MHSFRLLATSTTLAAAACLALLAGCAQQGSLQGGPRDERPPVLDTLRSTPFLQTGFRKQRIELTFNEWIKLDDPINQVTVSPPLAKRPQITLHGKTVRFDFAQEDTLRTDATYVIQFGDAIKDLTEGNIAKNIRFVFATGNQLDSATIQGQITDVLTGQPVEKVLLMLYNTPDDSVVRREKPFYLGRSDKQGNVTIANIRPGTYKVLALEDKVANLLYDFPAERIGFPDSAIVVPSNGKLPLLRIRLSEPRKPLVLNDRNTREAGIVRLAFNRPPFDAGTEASPSGPPTYTETRGDSLLLWYKPDSTLSWTLLVKTGSSLADTVKIKSPAPKKGLRFLLPAASRLPAAQKPDRPLALVFDRPLNALSQSSLALYEDTLGKKQVNATFRIDSADHRRLLVSYPWKDDSLYRLDLLPGALEDCWGLSNDTIFRQSYRILSRKLLSEIMLRVDNLNPNAAYLIQLLSADKVVDEDHFQNKSAVVRHYTGLTPDTYTVKIIEDLNNNRRWDPADYWQHRQPEFIFQKKLETLKPDWTLDTTIGFERQTTADKPVEVKKGQ